jgi:hypothetical protein
VKVTIDTDTVEPEHLEELAALLRQAQLERAARIAELYEKPALGAYRKWREAT